MHTKNRSTLLVRTGTRLVMLAAILMLLFIDKGAPILAAPALQTGSPVYFSIAGTSTVPGTPNSGNWRDSDIYFWNTSAFSQVIDTASTGLNLPGGANIDGFDRVDDTHFYMSFTDTVTLPGGAGTAADEDVVYYNAGAWSLFFDGSLYGLGGGGGGSFDLDAISIVSGTLYFSTDNNNTPGGGGGGDDADIYRWNGGSSYTRIVDASTIGIPFFGGGNANVDGLAFVDATHFYLSFADNTTISGFTTVQDEDIVYYNNGTWSIYFDGTAAGLGASGNLDIDAFSLPAAAQPQTITFGALANKTFGDADFNVSATASSGLPVSFAASGNCTVSGTLVHLTGAGSCTITASQAGNSSYQAAPNVAQGFTIAQGSQTITFNPLPNKTTADPDFTVTASASSGLAVSFAATGDCTVTGALVHLTGAVGSCTITASQAGDANYTAAANVQQSFTIAAFAGVDLYAVSGTTTLGTQNVTVWGYNYTGAAATQPGGPTFVVNQGDTVAIVLHNQLTVNTGLLFQGQDMIPDRTGVAAGGAKTYSFTANKPGTYLYGAGLLPNAQYQGAMGLYGALIVRPATAGQAYDAASTAYDDEAVLVLSEVDAALNNSATPANFDMRNYKPRYFLINGVAYPNTANFATAAGRRVLLRYLNAGMEFHSMALMGTHQNVIANDGSPLAHSHRMVAETFGPGQTVDAIATIPAATADGSQFAIYDGNLMLRNSNAAGFGGMLTFLAVSNTPSGGDTVGPVTSNVAYSAGALTALISDLGTPNSNIAAAEYFIDTVGATGAGTAMSGAFASPTESVSAVVALPSGTHTIYVRGMDAANNWGAVASVLVNGGDATGPTTSGLTLDPSPTNGLVDVALHANADDSATGNSNIDAAEYTIDGGAAATMTVNLPAPIASLDTMIPSTTVAALSEGAHVVAVRSQDAVGNWGAESTISLVVDKTGPATTVTAVDRSPNNGSLPLDGTNQSVRVTATFVDAVANISAAEGFIDSQGADGAGFAFIASDGLFNSLSESGYADIPLPTVFQLTEGNHTIIVHAKDAAGNWGATSTGNLFIDKTAPTVVSITRLDASPTTATSVNFQVTFSENVTGVTSGNFSLVQTGGMTGASITSVTGGGATWTVTTSTGSGSGSLGLNLTSAAGITDIASNALSATGLPFVGQTYTFLSASLYFSISGNSTVPGTTSTGDFRDSDIYFWDGAAFSRVITASGINVPSGTNVDGFDRVDATHFYMSFSGSVTLPGAGTVQDEDVVYYNAGAWSLFFDGSANNVGNTDLDAISIVGGILYFSTDNTAVPTGVSGGGDDADIYSWNGSTFARVYDASTLGWSTSNVDGFVRVDATHYYLSYSGDTNIPGFGPIQDEDVIYYNAGTWSVYFDGTPKGLTSGNLDVDAFDLP
ncbi:MAG: multicopper oxidase family protein [Caldilineaceae bacterium]